MKKTTEKEESFQQSFEELEKIVHEFEKGDLDLDESLGKFERGLQLAESCKKRLQEVENRVIEIKKKFSSLQSNGDGDE